MMTIRCAVLRCLLPALLCSGALAQAPPACPPEARLPSAEQARSGQRDAIDHGFLWRISKSGRSSWLYGTVHVATLEWMFPGPNVSRAMRSSDTMALELDVLDREVPRRMAQGMARQAGRALPEPLQQRLQRRMLAECLPPQSLAGFTPELQVAALMSLAGRGGGLDPAFGIDLFLAGWGRAAGKAVVSLETPEIQLNALQSGSADETIRFVDHALDAIESGRAGPMLERVARVWADGDLATLANYESWCACMETPADRDAMARMLDERNPALADGIDALHARGRMVFAAVGSLHIIGPRGLPALLAQRGYDVERVAYRP